jgi:hypothetical protein
MWSSEARHGEVGDQHRAVVPYADARVQLAAIRQPLRMARSPRVDLQPADVDHPELEELRPDTAVARRRILLQELLLLQRRHQPPHRALVQLERGRDLRDAQPPRRLAEQGNDVGGALH